jgi:hypothetical protein
MQEETLQPCAYHVVRYQPNLIRDEWVNIGVLLEDAARNRLRARLIEEESEIARVRRLHPAADEALLRALPADFESQIAAAPAAAAFLQKLDQTLSNVLQFSPQKGLLAGDFDAELDRLYRDHVAPPHYARSGIFENTRAWIRTRLTDVFRRRKILGRMERGVKVEQFTQPGDPLRLDYAYRVNGTRGYVHALSLSRDPAQAKVLAYTAECIRARQTSNEFVAITEREPARENERDQFVARLLAAQQIEIVPLARIEMFAERLRPRLQ